MDSSKISIGMQVVCNELPDAQIYIVTRKMGFIVDLEYVNENGHVVRGGSIDCCVLKTPTKKQLQYANVLGCQK